MMPHLDDDPVASPALSRRRLHHLDLSVVRKARR
jgi:hypothetical protein